MKGLMNACSGGSAMWRGWRGVAKKISVGEFAGSRSVGSTWKRWIGNMKEYLRKEV